MWNPKPPAPATPSPAPEAAQLQVEESVLLKTIVDIPKGLAPGPIESARQTQAASVGSAAAASS